MDSSTIFQLLAQRIDIVVQQHHRVQSIHTIIRIGSCVRSLSGEVKVHSTDCNHLWINRRSRIRMKHHSDVIAFEDSSVSQIYFSLSGFLRWSTKNRNLSWISIQHLRCTHRHRSNHMMSARMTTSWQSIVLS